MNQVYLETARLLTQVAPLVLVDDTFALKGGTIIALSGRFPQQAHVGNLSLADLRLMVHTGLRRIYAAGTDGSVYVARPCVGIEDAKLRAAYQQVDDAVFAAVMACIRAGDIDTAAAERYHHHIVATILDRRGLIRYRAVFPDALPDWVREVIGELS